MGPQKKTVYNYRFLIYHEYRNSGRYRQKKDMLENDSKFQTILITNKKKFENF